MKKYINAVNYNIKHIFWFEFVFKFITALVCIPASRLFVEFIKKIYNLKFISIYNLQILFKNVSFYFILLGILLIVSLYFIFDISVIILFTHSGLDKNQIKYRTIIKEAFKKMIGVFKPRNLFYLLFPCLFIFIFNIGLFFIVYSFTDYIRILIGTITSSLIPIIGLIVLSVILLYLFTRCIFIFHDYVINDKSFIRSFKEVHYRNNLVTFILLILRKILSFIIIYLFVIGLAELFFYFREVINNILLSSVVSGLLIALLMYMLLYYHIKSMINDTLYINCRYYLYNDEKVSIVKDINKVPLYYRFIRYATLLLITLFFTIIMYKVNDKTVKYDFIFDYHIDVTAHRGAYDYAPENTISAFDLAYKIGVDYIELDVHETKDGYIYVMHDGSLYRTLKLDKKDYQVTWDEIKNRKIISDFKEYKDETVPLFEDVLKWAKDKDIKINIELKTTSKSTNLVKKVVELIHKYNYVDKCVVASFDLNAIRKVKRMDPNIKIVYLSNSLDYKDDIDIYSLHYSSITRDLVTYLHKNNKTLYVWTVNDPTLVKTLINMNVDNIISNDPIMVNNVIKNYKNKDKTNALFAFLIYLYK